MVLPELQPGLVIRYAYLWRDEADRGRDGDRVVTVAPITHSPPPDSRAVAIPPATKQRLGLDDLPSWIVTDDLNEFAWPGPDLRPIPQKPPGTFAYGLIPAGLYNAVRQRIVEHARARTVQLVRRDDR